MSSGSRRPQLFSYFLFICLIAILSLGAGATSPLAGRSADPGPITLSAPSFLEPSVAEAGTSTIGAYLDSEAGLSAYFKSASSIDLNSAKNLYRTIEDQTSIYLIGSIPVPGYDESQDMHAYISTDGWVLVYYPKAVPTGRVFDWKSYNGGTTIPTRHEKVLQTIAATIGAGSPTITYYDFRYPNATYLLLVADTTAGADTDSFDVNLPSSYVYYDRSWSLGTGYSGDLKLDGNQLALHYYTGGFQTSEGILSAAQLLPDTTHTVATTESQFSSSPSYGGLTLVYRVP